MEKQNQWLLPVLTLAASLALFFAFHLQRAVDEKIGLRHTLAVQEKPLAMAKELQQRLDRLAVGTLRLAEGGNENAKVLVERLKQAGVTITPPKNEVIGTPK